MHTHSLTCTSNALFFNKLRRLSVISHSTHGGGDRASHCREGSAGRCTKQHSVSPGAADREDPLLPICPPRTMSSPASSYGGASDWGGGGGAAHSMGGAPAVKYICGRACLPPLATGNFSATRHVSDCTRTPFSDCGADNQIGQNDVIRCKECGHRILYKKRTSKGEANCWPFSSLSFVMRSLPTAADTGHVSVAQWCKSLPGDGRCRDAMAGAPFGSKDMVFGSLQLECAQASWTR